MASPARSASGRADGGSDRAEGSPIGPPTGHGGRNSVVGPIRTSVLVGATALAGLLISILVGCGLEPGTGRLAQYPGLENEIERFYERAYLRDDPRCRSARFEGVTQSEVITDDAEQLVLEIRYYYAGGSGSGRRCRGFGQRTVTVAKVADGFEVVAMSDPLNR